MQQRQRDSEEAEDTGALIMEWKFLRASWTGSRQGKRLEMK